MMILKNWVVLLLRTLTIKDIKFVNYPYTHLFSYTYVIRANVYANIFRQY